MTAATWQRSIASRPVCPGFFSLGFCCAGLKARRIGSPARTAS